ncbi:NAD-dependent epimerase/dehydratase family protein [Streptomyces verrucosisporus]|uniref:NAD-dependent epimerase/dehydratase family protein n=1 Tax=Streptomyces verrucosisporus TaxID=1695161 RepID=UPI0019D21396|nr:NAD-dependent epimerase/dehydratase family protein [Streptomyces verrucosisporus]MBN3933099.1 NAD-dependent epimerase/dehydratase family protein [Streptomyces verrucosisporus]
MARVVVTGGCGFVGSHLVDELARRGHEVTVFDGGAPPPDREPSSSVRYVTGDVRDAARLAEVVREGVDTVYHLAAVVGVDRYLDRPVDVIDINLLGTRNVLDLAARAGAKVVVASTSEVFGKNPAVPWREDDDRVLGSTAVDRWCYSTSKALGEHLAFAFARERGLKAAVVRYFNVYGPRQRPAFVVSRSVHRALNGRPPVVYDDGGQTRCFTFVRDAVDATIAVGTSEAAVGECFNVGSSTETTVVRLGALVAELTGTGAAVPVGTRDRLGDRYQDLRRRVPDTAKIMRTLGWRCTTDLRDGLAETIAWARRNPWWLAQPDSGVEPDGEPVRAAGVPG